MGTQDIAGTRNPPDHPVLQRKNGPGMILKDSKERGRFLRFMVVGTIGAVIDLGTFNLLSSVLGVPALFAQAVSFSLAVVSNFLWNRYWTYPDSRNKPVVSQLGQFLIVSVIGLTIRTLIFDRLQDAHDLGRMVKFCPRISSFRHGGRPQSLTGDRDRDHHVMELLRQPLLDLQRC